MSSRRHPSFPASSWAAFLESHPTAPLPHTCIADSSFTSKQYGQEIENTTANAMRHPMPVHVSSIHPRVRGHTIDSHLRRRLTRGDFVKDAILDLHGFREDEAFTFLCQRLPALYQADKRFILVITGRGLHSHGQAVLRERFLDWVNLEPLTFYVLAHCIATAQDGGAGAFYVLLRRRRASF